MVTVYPSPTNLGFAGGNNLALRALGFGDPQADFSLLPKAVYLLNPDTVRAQRVYCPIVKDALGTSHPWRGGSEACLWRWELPA
jgi:hypothetical protein